MAKMNLLAALQAALEATKAYVDDNHYNQSEVDTLLASKQDASSALKLGTSSSTAFRGDQGLTAYNHSQAAHAPSNAQKNSDITKAEIEAKLTGAITSHTHSYAGSSSAGGAATSANKVNSNLAIKLNGGSTEGTDLFTFNGSSVKTINITPENIGAAKSSHGTHVSLATATPLVASGSGAVGSSSKQAREDHVHPVQTSVSGNAGSADKVNNSLIIKINGGTTEGTNMFTFDGSGAKTINLKASDLGAPTSHNHDDRYYTETEINTKLGEVQDDIQAAVDGYEGAIEGAKTELQTAINNEATSRVNADNALDARLDVLEGSGTGSVAKALADAKSYADTKVAGILDSAPETLNTLNELAAALGDDPNFATTVMTEIGKKANSQHGNHVPTTQTANNAVFLRNDNTWATVTPDNIGAAKASHGTHVSYSTDAPKAAGTAAAGSSASVARADHVHPVQTSVSGNAGSANKVNNALSIQLNGGTATSFDGSATKSINITPSSIGAAAAHNHDAYVNKNAFANIKVGDTTVAADAVQDTVELVAGSNITITPDATNDKITIAAKDTVYTHPNDGANTGSFGNSSNQTPGYGSTFNVPYITVNSKGHVTAISNKTVQIPASDNTWRGIQNNLTSTSTSDSLSANQGKVLKGLVDGKADMIEESDLTAMLSEVFSSGNIE